MGSKKRENSLPDGYRMTELGPLPEEWRVVRLGEVVEKMKAGGTPRRSIPEYWNGEIPFAIIEDITRGGLYLANTKMRISLQGLKNSNAWIVPPGSLLVTMYGTIGATAINTVPMATNQAILAIIPNRRQLDTLFAAYLIRHSSPRLERENVQSTQKNVSKTIISRFKIPLPPLPEQRAIAHVLRAVQEAKEATERVIAAARELKKSLMRHLFTYGPVPVDAADRVPMQETEIGPIPAHWRVVKLGEVFNIQQGKALSRKKDKGIRPRPFLRTANVLWGRIDLSTLDEMDFTPEEEQKYALQYGDLLVCEGGDIGRTAIWEDQLSGVYYQNHLHRLRRRTDSVEPRFYMYWMQAALTLLGLYSGAGNKTTIPNLSRTRLAAFLIPLPPLPEQQEIARILQTVDEKIRAEEERKRALEELFKTLLHDLMTAKRRLPEDFIARFDKGEKP